MDFKSGPQECNHGKAVQEKIYRPRCDPAHRYLQYVTKLKADLKSGGF